MIRPGLLNKRVEIQRITSQPATDAGGYTEVWATFAKRWASINPLRGKEYLQADSINSNITHRIRIRFDHGLSLTPRDRIKFGTRIFNFESVKNIQEGDIALEIMAVEAL